MSGNRRNLDGTVSIRRIIEFYDTMSELEYEIREALYLLSDEEKEKLKKYLIRMTKGRMQLGKRKRRKASIKYFQDVDKRCREIYEL